MALLAFMDGASMVVRLTYDRQTPVLTSELSAVTRLTHDRETQVLMNNLSVEEEITASADSIIRNVSIEHAGVLDPETGEPTPFYGVEGDVSDTV